MNNDQMYTLSLLSVSQGSATDLIVPSQNCPQAQVGYWKCSFINYSSAYSRHYQTPQSSPLYSFGCAPSGVRLSEYQPECLCAFRGSSVYVPCLRVCGVINSVSPNDTREQIGAQIQAGMKDNMTGTLAARPEGAWCDIHPDCLHKRVHALRHAQT